MNAGAIFFHQDLPHLEGTYFLKTSRGADIARTRVRDLQGSGIHMGEQTRAHLGALYYRKSKTLAPHSRSSFTHQARCSTKL